MSFDGHVSGGSSLGEMQATGHPLRIELASDDVVDTIADSGGDGILCDHHAYGGDDEENSHHVYDRQEVRRTRGLGHEEDDDEQGDEDARCDLGTVETVCVCRLCGTVEFGDDLLRGRERRNGKKERNGNKKRNSKKGYAEERAGW